MIDNFFNMNESYEFMLQRFGELIKVDNIDRTAIIHRNSNKNIEELKILCKDPIERGNIVKYKNNNYIIMDDTSNIRYSTYYRAIIQKSNYNINFATGNVIFPQIAIITNKSIDLETGQWVILPSNKIFITVQANSVTDNIKVADRFIKFKQAWYIEGVDYTKNGILVIQAKQDTIQSGDDLINEIPAGAATYNPIVSATPNPLNININSTSKITATVTLNGTNVENPTLIYTSSNSDICTVDNTGLVTGVAEGNANIIVSYVGIDGNTYSTTISASVVALPQHNYTLEMTPYDDSYWDDDTHTSVTIRDGDSCEFDAILKDNGNIVDNARFDFSIDYNGNATNILGFKVDSDIKCTVTNIKYPYVVYLECKYRDDNTVINRIKINLKALW
ncbi:Ig-like domain-containing protein [Clostridium tyrobutyricum]|uniref:Ig-like domain-containing protein n=1 Tax=Clostridium tyrobutyricum TaxID=1519 RepID=UPI00068BECDA|nr:Ig-like domain-containing protein [Clostridium tyrobutyricum]